MEETKIIPVKNFEEGDEVENEITPSGDIKFKKKEDVKKRRKARSAGLRFELKVRGDLVSKGWVIDKWSNNVDLEGGKIVTAKKNWKFNPFKKIMMPSTQGTGFPDFIAIQHLSGGKYSVIGVEVKTNGLLSKTEKEKCVFYLKNKVFRDIWIAKKSKERGKIEYDDFKERYEKLFD